MKNLKKYNAHHGNGAAIFGGRWNKKGSPVLYTGENKEIDILTLEIPDDS